MNSFLSSASTSFVSSTYSQTTPTSTYVYDTPSVQSQTTNDYTHASSTPANSYNPYTPSSRPEPADDYSDSSVFSSILTSAPTAAYEIVNYQASSTVSHYSDSSSLLTAAGSSTSSQEDQHFDFSDLSTAASSLISYPSSSSSPTHSDFNDFTTTSASSATSTTFPSDFSSSSFPSLDTNDAEASTTSHWWSYTSSSSWDHSYIPFSSSAIVEPTTSSQIMSTSSDSSPFTFATTDSGFTRSSSTLSSNSDGSGAPSRTLTKSAMDAYSVGSSTSSSETSPWDPLTAAFYYPSGYNPSITTTLSSSPTSYTLTTEKLASTTTESANEWYSSWFLSSASTASPTVTEGLESTTSFSETLSTYQSTPEQVPQVWTTYQTAILSASAATTVFSNSYTSATYTTPTSTWESFSSTSDIVTAESSKSSSQSNFYPFLVISTEVASTVESSNSLTKASFLVEATPSSIASSVGEGTLSSELIFTSSYDTLAASSWSNAIPTITSSLVQAVATATSIWTTSNSLALSAPSSFAATNSSSTSSYPFPTSAEISTSLTSMTLNHSSSSTALTGSATKSEVNTTISSETSPFKPSVSSASLETSSLPSRHSSSHLNSTSTINTGYSVSYGTKTVYYIYTQTYVITASSTTFGTGIPTTVAEPLSVSTSFSAPQTIVTQDIQFYNNWLNNDAVHTSTHQSSGGGKSDTGKIVGGVVGGVCGLLACCLVTWIIFRRRRNSGQGNSKAEGFSSEIGARLDYSTPELPQTPAFVEKPNPSADGSNGTQLFSIFRTEQIPSTQLEIPNPDSSIDSNTSESEGSNPFRDEFNFKQRPPIPPPVPPPRKMHSNTQHPVASRNINSPRDNRSSYVSSLGDSSFVSSLQGDYSTMSSGPIRLDPSNYNAGNPEGPTGGFFREVI